MSMKYVKKFESFDFNQTIPATSKNVLTNYYSCDECDSLWKKFNETSDKCKFCGSVEIEDLDEYEFYDLQKSRLGHDEIKDMDSEREKESEIFVDLFNLKKGDNYVN